MPKVKFTFLITLLFSVTSVSASSAKWERIFENATATLYLDFRRIEKKDHFVYFWSLVDYVKPTEQGHLSSAVYSKGDCKLFRVQRLSYTHYKAPMGRDGGQISKLKKREWRNPAPVSLLEVKLKSVCGHIFP